MWLLIVISTIWDHGAHEHTYNITPISTQARCEQMAQAINDFEKNQTPFCGFLFSSIFLFSISLISTIISFVSEKHF